MDGKTDALIITTIKDGWSVVGCRPRWLAASMEGEGNVSPPGGTFLININVVVYYMPPILPSRSKLVRRNRLHRGDRFLVSLASTRAPPLSLSFSFSLWPQSIRTAEFINNAITGLRPGEHVYCVALHRWQLMKCGCAIIVHLHVRAGLMRLGASEERQLVRSSHPRRRARSPISRG